MAKYKGIVTTDAGLELLAKACSGGSVKFTAVKTGDGTYDGTEDLSGMTALKSERQSFGVSGITRTGTQVKVRSVLNNEGLTAGYNITEVGLFATDPDTGSEFLYAIIVAETGLEDYLPPHEDSPSSITMEIYLTLTETENDVKFTAEVVAGTYASAEAFQEFVDNVTGGATPVGNAKKLDGHGAEYFASVEEVNKKVNILNAPSVSGVTSYTIFAKVEKKLNGDHPRATVLLSNFSDVYMPSGICVVHISYYRQRVSMSARVLSGEYDYKPVTFGYYSDDDYVYFGICNKDFAYARNIIDLGSNAITVGSIDILTTEPNGWTAIEKSEVATTDDLANYVKQFAQVIYVGTEGESVSRTVALQNSKRKILLTIDADGNFSIWDSTNGKNILSSYAGGTSAFSGTLTTKPTGTYTGNGTTRFVTTGGSGSVVLIRQTGSTNHIIVDMSGYFGAINGKVDCGSGVSTDGYCNISLASDSVFNTVGATYEYRVL